MSSAFAAMMQPVLDEKVRTNNAHSFFIEFSFRLVTLLFLFVAEAAADVGAHRDQARRRGRKAVEHLLAQSKPSHKTSRYNNPFIPRMARWRSCISPIRNCSLLSSMHEVEHKEHRFFLW